MKNKNRILKNYLNNTTFSQGLLNQQNRLIEFYNSINIKNNHIIENELNYYSNRNQNIEIKKLLVD